MNYCQVCGCEAPTKKASLYKQTGMLVLRQTSTLSGYMCKKCLTSNALSFTGWNLIAGWWGVISAISNPFYIINNLVYLAGSMGLEPPPPDAAPPVLQQATIDTLSPLIPRMSELFQRGLKLPEVATQISKESGVEGAQVVVFIQALAASR